MNASFGLWLSRDPIGEAGGLNLYGYVANDPINFIDPLGDYASPWHGLFSFTAAIIDGKSPIEAAYIAGADIGTDFVSGSQLPENANWHSMAQPGQSKEDAKICTGKRIDKLLSTGSDVDLGAALHANEDAFARGHRFQTYNGESDIGLQHILGDLFPTPTEMVLATATDVLLIGQADRKK